jgi:hypothetical protein
MADVTFRIAAELNEVKAALADLRRQLAGAGAGADKSFKPVNDELDKTAAKSRTAATEAEKLAAAQERAARRAQAAQERAARQQERDAQRAARAQEKAAQDAERVAQRTAQRQAQAQQRDAQRAQREATQQQRQLAPQLTDIGVGLATGQSPFLLLLQQGGQLKDIFGGIVPAAKAVGGAVLGLINPVTVLGGAIAAVAIGYVKGADEGARFRRIVEETGGVSGITAAQMDQLAQSLGNLAGSTRASAAATISEVASSGKFASQQIAIVAKAAEQLRNGAGRDVSATIAEFAKLGDDPVKAADELNRRYGFLTGAIAAQIRQLRDQGREQEASTLAMRAYAAAVDERTPKIRQNLGLLERAWRAISEGTRNAGNALLNIGRSDEQGDFDRLVRRRQELQARLDGVGRNAGRRRAADQAELDSVTAQIQRLQDARVQAEQEANRNSARARAVSAQESAATAAQALETAEQRLTRERVAIVTAAEKAIADARTAGEEDTARRLEASRDTRLAAIEREAARTPLAAAQASATAVRDSTERSIEDLQRLYDRGLVSAREFFAKRRDLQLQAVDADIAAQRAELATTQEQGDIVRISAQIRVLERRKADIRRDAIRDEARATQALQEQLLDVEVGLQRDALDRALGIMEANFDRQEVATKDYLAARQALQLAAIDNDLAITRKRLESQELSPADRARLLADEEKLLRAREDVRLRTITDGARAERDLERQLADLRAQNLEAQGQTAEATRIRIEAQFADLLKRLQADGNAAGVRLVRGLINTGVANAQFAELQRKADEAFAALERRRAEIQDQVRAGTLTPQQGSEADLAARRDFVGQIEPINRAIQEIGATSTDPAVAAGAERIGRAVAGIAESGQGAAEAIKGDLRQALQQMNDTLAQSATNAGVDAVQQLFIDLTDRSKTAGEALKEFVRGFAQSMLQIATRALATYAVLQFLDAVYPGLGRSVAAGVSVGANVKHGGGMAGEGPRRNVPAWVFAGAPRFHNGSGVLGLKSDEIPAILQTGERVQSREEVAAMRSGGGGVRVINVVDPNLLQDYLSTPAGERVLVNAIRRNRGAVRQELG